MVTSITIVLLVSSLTCAVMSDVTLTFDVSPPYLIPFTQTNLTITCRARSNQWDQEYLASLSLLKSGGSGYRMLAQVSDMDPDNVYIEDDIQGSWSGKLIRERYDRGQLTLTWENASSVHLGSYKCLATYYSQNQVVTKTKIYTVGSDFNAEKLLLVMQIDKLDITKELASLASEVELSQNALNTEVQENLSGLSKEIGELDARLNRTLEENADNWEMLKQRLLASIEQSQANTSQRLEELDSELQALLERGFLQLWPAGTYGLTMSASGCPSSSGLAWSEGLIRYHTESTDRNKDRVTKDNHFKQPVLSRDDGQNFVYQSFCVKKDKRSPGPTWPNGSYCVNKFNDCPYGFNTGSIYIAGENTDAESASSGQLPDGAVSNSSSKLFYCCRDDGAVDQVIELPRSQPFYLYRRGGQCQMVAGMSVTEELIQFDTENSADYPVYEVKGAYPDVEITNNVVALQFCYYKMV